jgi:small subunit ribosomal protein S3e
MSDEKRVRKLNTKKKFVADGVFNAELNGFLGKVLGMEGYAGIEIRSTSVSTEIRIKVAKHDELKEKGARRVREITSLIQKRYNFNDEDNKVEIVLRPLEYDRALCAAANAENLKFKLLSGTPCRMAVNNIMGGIMRRNAVGVEILVSGKVRGQRAKAQKYASGYLISTGQPMIEFIDVAVRHVNMRAGVLGVKVKIMRDIERKVKSGETVTTMVMPDFIRIHDPKDEPSADPGPRVVFAQQRESAQQQQ